MQKRIKRDETGLPFYLQDDYIDWRKEYREKCRLLEEDYKEVDCRQFYSDIFPPETIESCWEDHRPNPILTYCKYLKENGTPAMFHATVYNDYQNLELVRDNQMALLGMCSYSGSAPTGKNAYRCHGLCIDLDDVTCLCLQHVLCMVYEAKLIPVPQYIAVSGGGIHVYYVFEDPVPLYPQNREALNQLKLGLTRLLWNPHTTRKLKDCQTEDDFDRASQYQNIYQRYRAVGSKSKLAWKTKINRKSKYIIRAWMITERKTCVEELNHYVNENYQIQIREAGTPLPEAKERWPEWYERLQMEERKAPGTYLQTRGLYTWWLRILKLNARQGNRYYYLAILFAMAKKSGVAYSEVYKQAEKLVEILDERTEPGQEHFNKKDLNCASRFFHERSFRLSNDYIYQKTGYRADGSIKRNGRSRAEHMRYMSECRKAASYEHVGRPKGTGKQKIIWEWRRNHPEGSKADCIRETGLSKPTVYKWWNLLATAKNPPFVEFDIRSSLQSGRMQHQRMYQYYILFQRKAS